MTIKTKIIIGAVAAAASVLALKKVRSLITADKAEKKEDASVDIPQDNEYASDEACDCVDEACDCACESARRVCGEG